MTFNRCVSFIKSLSFFLAFSFFLTELSYSAPLSEEFSTLQGPKLLEVLSQDPTRFEAPLDFSTLKEIHKGQNGTFIIHIQDAHSNLSGQQNLASTLDEIMKRYKVSLVLVEGGSKEGTLTPIKEVVSRATLKKAAKSLLIEGQISGEEYLNLVSEHPMKIMGIEDIALYAKSVRDYGLLADKREAILEYLKTIQNALEKLKRKFYPEEIIQYEKESHDKERAFESNFKKLIWLAQTERVDLKEFPNIQKLIALQERETKIDFKLANLEQAALIEEITQKGGMGDLEGQFTKLKQMKNQKVSQFAFFQNIFNIAKEKNISLSKYPNLTLYGTYLEEFSSLDLDGVLQELERAEDKVYLSLLTTNDARLVRSIDRYLRLLNTAYNIQMSTKDFKLFQANEPDFATVSYLAFMNTKLVEQGYFQDIIPYKNILEEGKKALMDFYDSVDQRDIAFVQNTERILKEENQKVAVLITGGYHTPHLKELLKGKGCSYAVLAPLVNHETNQKKYEKLLLAPLNRETKIIETAKGESKNKSNSTNEAKVRRFYAAFDLPERVLSRLGVSDTIVRRNLDLEKLARQGEIEKNEFENAIAAMKGTEIVLKKPSAARLAAMDKKEQLKREFIKDLKSRLSKGFVRVLLSEEEDAALRKLGQLAPISHGFHDLSELDALRKMISSMLDGAVRPMELFRLKDMDFKVWGGDLAKVVYVEPLLESGDGYGPYYAVVSSAIRSDKSLKASESGFEVFKEIPLKHIAFYLVRTSEEKDFILHTLAQANKKRIISHKQLSDLQKKIVSLTELAGWSDEELSQLVQHGPATIGKRKNWNVGDRVTYVKYPFYGIGEITEVSNRIKVKFKIGTIVEELEFDRGDADHQLRRAGRGGYGARLAVWTEEQVRRAMDIVRPMSAFGPDVTHITFSPDGKRMVVSYSNARSKLFDESGKDLTSLFGVDISGIYFSPDGKKLGVWYFNGSAKLFDETGKDLTSLFGVNIKGIAFSPDGKKLGVWYINGSAKLFDETGKDLKFPFDSNVMRITLSPDGKRVVIWHHDGTPKLFDEKGKDLKFPFYSDAAYATVSFSPDGKRMVISYRTSTELFDETGKKLKFPSGADTIDFSPDGKRLVARYHNGTAKLFDETGKDLTSLFGVDIRGITFSPDGKKLGVWYVNGSAKLFDETGKDLTSLFGVDIRGITFSPDGKRVAISYSGFPPAIFDIESLEKNPLLQEASRKWGKSTNFGLYLCAYLFGLNKEPTVEDFLKIYDFVDSWAERFEASTTDYNRSRIIDLFKSSRILEHLSSQNADSLRHLDFYLVLLEQNKRLALQILEEVFESQKKGVISMRLPAEEQNILKIFVKLTNGFNHVLYRIMKERGEAKLKEYLAFGEDKILTDQAGPEDFKAFRQKVKQDGFEPEEVLLAVTQKAIPASGASFVKKEEIKRLAQKFHEIPRDTRQDIPQSLKDLGRFGGGKIQRIEWILKKGERYDSKGRIKSILEALRYPDSGKDKAQIDKDTKEDKEKLLKALKELLADFENSDKRESALQAFLAFARHNDLLKEKIDRIQDQSYTSLELLDTLFRDKDNLTVLLREVLKDSLTLDGQQDIRDPKPVKKAILGVPMDKRSQNIPAILSKFKRSEIEGKILPDAEIPEDIKSLIRDLLAQRLTRTPEEIAEALLEGPVKAIEAEKNRFEEQISPDSVDLKFQVVKGPGYGLWGLNAGVCIATDLNLWQNKNFYLLAIIDEAKKEAVGFVHLFQHTNKDGQKLLTVPGIEPSAEFLGKVKAREIYPMIVEALQTVGKAGGFGKVVIPTDSNILSNRSDIQDLVVKANYSKAKLLEKVYWNTVPSPYPFTEVYELPRAREIEEELTQGAVEPSAGFRIPANERAYDRPTRVERNAKGDLVIQSPYGQKIELSVDEILKQAVIGKSGEKNVVIIGREGRDSDLIVRDSAASRRHAMLELRVENRPEQGGLGYSVFLKDLNSRHGTFDEKGDKITGEHPLLPFKPFRSGARLASAGILRDLSIALNPYVSLVGKVPGLTPKMEELFRKSSFALFKGSDGRYEPYEISSRALYPMPWQSVANKAGVPLSMAEQQDNFGNIYFAWKNLSRSYSFSEGRDFQQLSAVEIEFERRLTRRFGIRLEQEIKSSSDANLIEAVMALFEMLPPNLVEDLSGFLQIIKIRSSDLLPNVVEYDADNKEIRFTRGAGEVSNKVLIGSLLSAIAEAYLKYLAERKPAINSDFEKFLQGTPELSFKRYLMPEEHPLNPQSDSFSALRDNVFYGRIFRNNEKGDFLIVDSLPEKEKVLLQINNSDYFSTPDTYLAPSLSVPRPNSSRDLKAFLESFPYVFYDEAQGGYTVPFHPVGKVYVAVESTGLLVSTILPEQGVSVTRSFRIKLGDENYGAIKDLLARKHQSTLEAFDNLQSNRVRLASWRYKLSLEGDLIGLTSEEVKEFLPYLVLYTNWRISYRSLQYARIYDIDREKLLLDPRQDLSISRLIVGNFKKVFPQNRLYEIKLDAYGFVLVRPLPLKKPALPLLNQDPLTGLDPEKEVELIQKGHLFLDLDVKEEERKEAMDLLIQRNPGLAIKVLLFFMATHLGASISLDALDFFNGKSLPKLSDLDEESKKALIQLFGFILVSDKYLDNVFHNVRGRAAQVIYELASPTTVSKDELKVLFQGIDDSYGSIRESIVDTLIKLKNPAALEILLSAWKSSRGESETELRKGLEFFMSVDRETFLPRIVDDLVQSLSADEISVRVRTIEMLGEIGPDASKAVNGLRAIHKAMRGFEEGKLALEALSKITKKTGARLAADIKISDLAEAQTFWKSVQKNIKGNFEEREKAQKYFPGDAMPEMEIVFGNGVLLRKSDAQTFLFGLKHPEGVLVRQAVILGGSLLRLDAQANLDINFLRDQDMEGIGWESFMGMGAHPASLEARKRAQEWEAGNELPSAWSQYMWASYYGDPEALQDAERVKEKWLQNLRAEGFQSISKDKVAVVGELEFNKSLDDLRKHPDLPLKLVMGFVHKPFSHAILYHGDLHVVLSFDDKGKLALITLADSDQATLDWDFHYVDSLRVRLDESKQAIDLSFVYRGREIDDIKIFRKINPDGTSQTTFTSRTDFRAQSKILKEFPLNNEEKEAASEIARVFIERNMPVSLLTSQALTNQYLGEEWASGGFKEPGEYIVINQIAKKYFIPVYLGFDLNPRFAKILEEAYQQVNDLTGARLAATGPSRILVGQLPNELLDKLGPSVTRFVASILAVSGPKNLPVGFFSLAVSPSQFIILNFNIQDGQVGVQRMSLVPETGELNRVGAAMSLRPSLIRQQGARLSALKALATKPLRLPLEDPAKEAALRYRQEDGISRREFATIASTLVEPVYAIFSMSIEGQDISGLLTQIRELKEELKEFPKLHVYFELVDREGSAITEEIEGFQSEALPKELVGKVKVERMYSGVLNDDLVKMASNNKAGLLGTEAAKVTANTYNAIPYKLNARAGIATAIKEVNDPAVNSLLKRLMRPTGIFGTAEVKLVKQVPEGATAETYKQKELFVKALAINLAQAIYRAYVTLIAAGASA